jgi:hypothetical protein
MKKTVFIKVDVTKGLPKVDVDGDFSITVFAINENGGEYRGYFDLRNSNFYLSGGVETRTVTHWLKEVELNCFTDAELQEFHDKVFEAGKQDGNLNASM